MLVEAINYLPVVRTCMPPIVEKPPTSCFQEVPANGGPIWTRRFIAIGCESLYTNRNLSRYSLSSGGVNEERDQGGRGGTHAV